MDIFGALSGANAAGKMGLLGSALKSELAETPGVGTMIQAGQAMSGVNRAVTAGSMIDPSETPEQQAQLGREEDRGIGDAIWHGLGAVGSLVPGVGLGMGALNVASNVAYGQSPGAVAANWLNGVPGGQHLSENANAAAFNHEYNSGMASK